MAPNECDCGIVAIHQWNSEQQAAINDGNSN